MELVELGGHETVMNLFIYDVRLHSSLTRMRGDTGAIAFIYILCYNMILGLIDRPVLLRGSP